MSQEGGATVSFEMPVFVKPASLKCSGFKPGGFVSIHAHDHFEDWWFRNGEDYSPFISKELARAIFNREDGSPPLCQRRDGS